ncbi:MAG: biopolymer transporter ExbD [Bdellovibrionota bacterium]|nr:biopolymer transporter ExbD [Bdellovibrionota bacterium]
MAKETNEELNLTPFIGLFAMLVVLLLLTAVWNQIEVLSTNSANSTASNNPSPPSEPEKEKIDLSVSVLEDKVQVSLNSQANYFPILDSEINKDQLSNYMKKVKNRYPEKSDVLLYTDNRIPYRHLIEVFDLLVGVGFQDVGVSTQ